MRESDRLLVTRYAAAYLRAAEGKGLLKESLNDMKDLQEVIDNQDLLGGLKSPLHSARTKMQAILSHLKKTPSPLFRRFLETVIHRKRAALFLPIVKRFEALWEKRNGHIRASARSPRPLTAAEKQEIQHKLSPLGRVTLQEERDPSLLAGIVLQVEDRLWDGSLKERLRHLKQGLLT